MQLDAVESTSEGTAKAGARSSANSDWRVTPQQTVEMGLLNVMLHLRPPASSCCDWHGTATVVMKEIEQMAKDSGGKGSAGCRPRWKSNSDWQCPSCGAMNAWDVEHLCECCLCGEAKQGAAASPALTPSEGSGSSHSCQSRAAQSER